MLKGIFTALILRYSIINYCIFINNSYVRVCFRVAPDLPCHSVAWLEMVSSHTATALCESCVTSRPTLIGLRELLLTNHRPRCPMLRALPSHAVMVRTVRRLYDAGRRFHRQESMKTVTSVGYVQHSFSFCSVGASISFLTPGPQQGTERL